MKLEWIDINLPWHVSMFTDADRPICPDLSDREREVFGMTADEEFGTFEDSLIPLGEISAAVHAKLNEWLENQPDGTTDDQINDQEVVFWDEYKDHPAVKAREAHIEYSVKYNQWYNSQPEVIEFNKKCDEHLDMIADKSFAGRGLARPGTLIELEDGTVEMIGSINTFRGISDTYTAFDGDRIVKRYAVVMNDDVLTRKAS